MEQVPALVDLKETGQVAFLLNETGKGQWEAVIQLLIQIAACACYTEVKVVCFYQKQAAWQEKIVECIREKQRMNGKTQHLSHMMYMI